MSTGPSLDPSLSVVKISADGVAFDWTAPFRTSQPTGGIGTGFFFQTDDESVPKNYILTCFHVVEDASVIKCTVTAIGKELFDCSIVAACPKLDVAVIQVDDFSYLESKLGSKKIQHLVLGDSDLVDSDDGVITYGFPMGEDKIKTTRGVVSGRQDECIQTDAPINPGNSGGPLVHAKTKQVIGINAKTYAKFVSDGIGYAIPMHYVRTVMRDIMKKPKDPVIEKPFMGAMFNTNTGAYMNPNQDNSSHATGWIVRKIFPGTPLQKATVSISEGDILTKISFNGTHGGRPETYSIDEYGEAFAGWYKDGKIALKELMLRVPHGENITLGMYSHKESRPYESVVTYAIPEDTPFKIVRMYPHYQQTNYETFASMVIMPFTQNHVDLFRGSLMRYRRKEHCLEPRLIVTDIIGGSFLSTTNTISEGTLIKTVNGIPVGTLEEFRNAVRGKTKGGGELKGLLVDPQKVFMVEGDEKPRGENMGASFMFSHYLPASIKEMRRLAKRFRFDNDLTDFFKEMEHGLNK